MVLKEIDTAFKTLLATDNVHARLGVSAASIRQLRHRFQKKDFISLDKKVELLQKFGWKAVVKDYTTGDLISLADFVLKQGAAGKAHGGSYLVQKWETVKKSA